jgi:hypothetical protein
MTDISSDNIAADRGVGGDGCAIVSKVEIGSGRAATAIVTLNNITMKPQLAIVEQRKGHWKIHTVRTFCSSLDGCFVKPLPAGVYKRTLADPGPLMPGERNSIVAKNGGVVSGTPEASAIAYVLDGRGWHYVLFSD